MSTIHSQARVQVVPMLVLLALGVLAAHHLANGFYYLAVDEPATAAADFYNRRIENAYFLDHISPQSQQFVYLGKSDPSLLRLATGGDSFERHGSVVYSGLPPWVYALQLGVFLPSSDRLARVYLAGLNVVALVIVAWLAYSEAGRAGASSVGRAVAVASVVAIGATNSTLMSGQIGLIINAGLALTMLALYRPSTFGWNLAGGIGLAIAMLKPSSALLFLLAPLMRRRLVLLGLSGAIIASAWLSSAQWVHLTPLFQLAQFERATQLVVTQGASVWLSALARVSSPERARNGFMVVGIVIAAIGAYAFRREPSKSFAFLAILSRVFTYHRAYDDVLLVFAVIYLGARAVSESRLSELLLAWVAAGVSLWLPYSFYMSASVQWVQGLCWTGIAAFLLLPSHAIRIRTVPHEAQRL